MPELHLALFGGREVNIKIKLALFESRQCVVGIKEGIFVSFYEQLLFGWQQWASKQHQLPTLKVLRKKVKKLVVTPTR